MSIKLPTQGAINIMTKCDLNPTTFLYPDLENTFLLTDVKNLSDENPVITNIEYISLDESVGLIGEIEDILFIKDRIIIHDNGTNSEAVFVFTIQGNGIKRIKAGGRGPAEFLGIAQIYTFPEEEFFVVKDNKSSRIQYFDLEGEHLKTEHTLIHSSNCKPINDSVLVFGANFRQNYHIEDLFEYSIYSGVKDSILFKGIPYAQHQRSSWKTNQFFTNHLGEIQIRQHANDSIYQIINDSTYFIPYVVKFDNSLQSKMEKLPEGSNFSSIYWEYVKEGYHSIDAFIENDNSVLYVCSGGGYVRYLNLYSKDKGESYIFGGIHPDYPLRMFWSGQVPKAVHDNKFVVAISGYEFYNATKKEIIITKEDTGEVVDRFAAEVDQSVADLVMDIDENSNHVLMLFRFAFQ